MSAALSGAAGTLLGSRPEDESRGDASWDDEGPLVKALGSAADACARLGASTEEIGRLWAAEEPYEPSDRASWQLSHVPAPLLVQTEETEDLVRALAVFLWVLAVH
ncbi:hypothetical protein [Streptomyces sp. NPDC127038]|uniref:hypothetical protein n=1 Tax=Streptomyces sp. NPDC127038 TaxID=3347114 RepID=UPI00364CFE8D